MDTDVKRLHDKSPPGLQRVREAKEGKFDRVPQKAVKQQIRLFTELHFDQSKPIVEYKDLFARLETHERVWNSSHGQNRHSVALDYSHCFYRSRKANPKR